jgi:hypothetical protein
VVIINEADQLSRDAQAALRRTMEKYMNNMRIILCANTTSKIIAPIRSRTLLVRVAAPNEVEVGHNPCPLQDTRTKPRLQSTDDESPEICGQKGEDQPSRGDSKFDHLGGKGKHEKGAVGVRGVAYAEVSSSFEISGEHH